MGNVFEYKGYHAKIEFDSEALVLRGRVEGINDLVNFESDELGKIETEFHEAVEDYLAFCEEVGKEPDKEYKGTFNVRIRPALHKRLALVAMKNGESLNSSVERAIMEYVMRQEDRDFPQRKDSYRYGVSEYGESSGTSLLSEGVKIKYGKE